MSEKLEKFQHGQAIKDQIFSLLEQIEQRPFHVEGMQDPISGAMHDSAVGDLNLQEINRLLSELPRYWGPELVGQTKQEVERRLKQLKNKQD